MKDDKVLTALYEALNILFTEGKKGKTWENDIIYTHISTAILWRREELAVKAAQIKDKSKND